MEKILGIAIINGKASCVEVNDDLEAWYELLGCTCVTMISRQIGKHCYDIVCDEEATFKEHNHVSATNKKKEVMLIGNIFICRSEGEDLTSLEPNDILHIAKRFHRTRQVNYETGEIATYSVIECEYPQCNISVIGEPETEEEAE